MITKDKFNELAALRGEPCVSMYIPTYRAGRSEEDRIRFKNAVTEAQQQLIRSGMEKAEAHRFLTQAYDLLEDTEFFSHLSDGLAVFISPKGYEQLIVPVHVNPFVWVSDRFYLRPVLPALTGRHRFFILALSQNEVRFFEGNKYSITPVIIEDLVPEDMEAALEAYVEEASLQGHSARPNRQTPIFHGHGLGKDHKLKQLRDYFRQIDQGLMEMLHDERAPMVLAGVDYLIPVYKEVSKYLNIAAIHIGGNPENDDAILLHEKAWAIIDEFNQKQMDDYRENFGGLLSKGKASTELSTIVRAAEAGKVETLFVDKDEQRWGRFYSKQQTVEQLSANDPGAVDLLEEAALATYLNGGTVYNNPSEELPVDAPVSATFRY